MESWKSTSDSHPALALRIDVETVSRIDVQQWIDLLTITCITFAVKQLRPSGTAAKPHEHCPPEIHDYYYSSGIVVDCAFSDERRFRRMASFGPFEIPSKCLSTTPPTGLACS